MSKTIYDIFVSYSSKDKKVAEGICAYLEQRHFRCFVAYRDIPKAKVWASAIVEALDESRMMVVVFSKNFNVSEQVDREIELAAEDHKPILTFRLSSDAFQGAKKYYLKNINWIDAFPEPDKCFGELAEEIEKLLGSPTVVVSSEREKTDNKSINNTQLPCLKLKADVGCIFYLDGEERSHLKAGIIQKIPLAKGEYELLFVSEENGDDRLELEFVMPDIDKLQKVKLGEVRDARLRKEAESKRIAEERRQADEIKRKEEAEARRIAEERRLAEEQRKVEENRLAEEHKRNAVLALPPNNKGKKQYDVFICFRRNGGREYARLIQLVLEKKYRVFKDYEGLSFNEFEANITDIIRNSSVFLLILSNGALNRCAYEDDWVRKEIMYAEQFGCHIVPVVVDNTFDTLPASLPDELRHVIGPLRWSIVSMGSLFEASMNKLESERIEPYIHQESELLYIDETNDAKFNLKESSHEEMTAKIIADIERNVNWHLSEEFYYISYSSKDRKKAEIIRRLLKEHGAKVWMAPDDIPIGTDYSLVIPTAIRFAKQYVLILTKESANSRWVKRELAIAISNQANTRVKVLLADGFSINDIRRDNELMFYLNRVQVKFEYDDVTRNQDSLDRFISE